MTSYRGVEAIDCVGMQPVVEPGLGLCDNLKPNRFWELNENAFKGLAGSFIFCKGRVYMDLLQQSAQAGKK